jgi:hypothetical protein
MKADIETHAEPAAPAGATPREHTLAHFLRNNTERQRGLGTNGTAGSACTDREHIERCWDISTG